MAFWCVFLFQDPNWYRARNTVGREGTIPANYVQKREGVKSGGKLSLMPWVYLIKSFFIKTNYYRHMTVCSSCNSSCASCIFLFEMLFLPKDCEQVVMLLFDSAPCSEGKHGFDYRRWKFHLIQSLCFLPCLLLCVCVCVCLGGQDQLRATSEWRFKLFETAAT